MGLLGSYKDGSLGREYYDSFIKSTTQLNKIGMELGALDSVTAMTDVTGFGFRSFKRDKYWF